MAFIHGKSAYFKVGSTDLSTFCDSVEFKRSADAHEVTAFGATGKAYAAGLTDGKVTAKGTYDDGAAGPKAILEPLLATTSSVTYRPEGTGSGKPNSACAVVVTSYDESTPVGDMIKWTAEFQISGAVTVTDQ